MSDHDQDDDGPIDRLNQLFRTVHRPDGRLWSDRAAARSLTDSGHPISHTQIGHIRAGRREPRFIDMVALARLFGKNAGYFTVPTAQRATASAAATPPTGRGTNAARLAARLTLLFTAVHPASRGPYSDAEVATDIVGRGGQVSEADIRHLRTIGRPATSPHLPAIADFFNVDPVYFDPVRGGDIERDLRAVVAMRDLQVRRIAARVCGLNHANLDAVAQIVEQVVAALEAQGGTTSGITSPLPRS